MANALTQHSREIEETKACWDQKTLLRTAYRGFHNDIKKHLSNKPGLTVELGSGIGTIKESIPECITTDINENPFVDRVEDAYKLSFADNTVANLILFDVWHHLEYPGSALQEFYRVLKDGGRIILFEPAALSWLGQVVFGLFHHEPINADKPPPYFIPEGVQIDKLQYYAAQGNAWRMFYREGLPESLSRLWSRPQITFYSAFDWLAAGGFRGRQFAPTFMLPILKGLSRLTQPFPKIFATRMLLVLDKQTTATTATQDESTA